jgi:hypothetical protein
MAIPSEDMQAEDTFGKFEIILLVSSFAAGIFVGIVCKQRKGLYAVLTTILFPSILPPTALLIWYALSVLDGQILHPFLIPILLSPVLGFMGAHVYHRNLTISYNLLRLSYVAGAIYVILNWAIFEQYDAVLAALFIIILGFAARLGFKNRTAKREHVACLLIILWAGFAVWSVDGNIGWILYFTALIIIPSLISIGLRIMTSDKS